MAVVMFDRRIAGSTSRMVLRTAVRRSGESIKTFAHMFGNLNIYYENRIKILLFQQFLTS
jgi:hypothetical protein